MSDKDQPTKILLVRGLLGAYMPGHFKKVLLHFKGLGYDIDIAPTLPHGTFQQNAKRLADYLALQARSKPLTVLAHSKGGIETLLALKDPLLQSRIASTVLLQTPRRGAPYLRSLFRAAVPRPNSIPAKTREHLHAVGLSLIRAKPACLELASNKLLPQVPEIESTKYAFPIFSFSSSSKNNSEWIELQAGRIEQLEPGKPNDGVFLTEDQVWEKFRHRELDFELDHAEPTVGSPRIEEARMWENLLRENDILPGLSL